MYLLSSFFIFVIFCISRRSSYRLVVYYPLYVIVIVRKPLLSFLSLIAFVHFSYSTFTCVVVYVVFVVLPLLLMLSSMLPAIAATIIVLDL